MKIVVVDIDGTIANIDHRLHYIENKPKDWDSFYDACVYDDPINEVIELVEMLDDKYFIVFCTGRRESIREETLIWLSNNTNLCGNFNLLMRKDGDKRPDTIVKLELINDYMIRNRGTVNGIQYILEDRDCMVKEWRKLGYKCLQVAEGNF